MSVSTGHTYGHNMTYSEATYIGRCWATLHEQIDKVTDQQNGQRLGIYKRNQYPARRLGSLS